MILVAGATGLVGRQVARSLLHEGHPVRILVRARSAYDDLVEAGAEAVVGDLTAPDSLDIACAGVEAVVTTATASSTGDDEAVEAVDWLGNRNLVDAASREGVRRFVFVSTLAADPRSPVPVFRAKGETEQRLRESDLVWTVLHATSFMDLLIPPVVGVPALAGRPVTLVGSGRRRHSFVAARDVAGYAAAAVHSPHAERRVLLVGGPEPLTWLDIVAVFSRELGREVPVQTVAPGAPIPGLPDVIPQMLAALDTFDSPIEIREVSATYGVRPTGVAEFVHGFVAGRVPAA